MTTIHPLQSEATNTVANAEFRLAWPVEVRQALVQAVTAGYEFHEVLTRAANTEGPIPAYAAKRVEWVTKQVRWALKEAQRIERKCAKDIETGERTLSQAQKRRLVGA